VNAPKEAEKKRTDFELKESGDRKKKKYVLDVPSGSFLMTLNWPKSTIHP
jgi:hypothetical protein